MPLHFIVKYADWYNNTLQHFTPYSWVCRDDIYRGQNNNSQLTENEKPLLLPSRTGLLKFLTVAELQNTGKPMKFTKICTIEILPNTCQFNIFETFLGKKWRTWYVWCGGHEITVILQKYPLPPPPPTYSIYYECSPSKLHACLVPFARQGFKPFL